MAVRKFKPVTPGQRNKVISAFDDITCKKPEKSLLEPLKSSGGRNNQGKMTMRYIGGGHKKMYRVIDFLRSKDDCKATVMTIEYDPNRSARIALVQYEDGVKKYILTDSRSVRSSLPVQELLLSLVTLFLLGKFRSVHLFTTSSFVLDRAPQWHVLPELTLSLQPARATTPSFVSLQVRPVWCFALAAQLSEQCQIRITVWSRTERQDAEDGLAVVHATVV